MRVFKSKKRGISLIELVVALSLISIILMIVGPFFISNYVTLDRTSNQIDFQREAKSIMNYFTDSAMEASNISSLTNIEKEVLSDSNTIYTDSLNSKTLSSETDGYLKLTFNNNEDNDKKTTFILKDETLYMKKNSGEFKIGNLVKRMSVTTLPSNTDLKDATSIKVEIEFDTRNNNPYKVSNILTFRNKKS